MTRALIRKELRDLLPWGLLCLALGGLDLVPELFKQLDRRPFAVTIGTFFGSAAVLSWLFAFTIATGLTTREQDDRTLAFLDGLPVSRTRVFLVKCTVTAVMVMLTPLMSLLVILFEHLLSRGSLDHELRPLLLLQMLGLHLLLICNGIALGAAIGRLRALTWLVVGTLAIGLERLIHEYPRAALLNPLRLVSTPLGSAGLTVDAQAAWVQALVAVLGFAIAWYMFRRAGQPRNLPSVPRPLVGALLTVATLVILGIALTLWFREDFDGAGERTAKVAAGKEEPRFVTSAPAQTTTRHYQLSYPAERSAAALALADRADAIFERVHQLLGVAAGASIAVDASGSVENTLGTAFFGRIRMELDKDAAVVLAHETAHVIARRLAGNTRASLWQRVSVLNEGLATWVERQFGSTEDRAEGLLVLAAMQTRRELLTEELFDDSLLGANRDPNLKYPAGEGMITAMVRLYGQQALPRLLRAFADARLPTDLDDEMLWQAAFQIADMDLGAVVDEFYREVSAYAKLHAAEIAALPRVRVRMVSYEGQYGIEALLDQQANEEPELELRFKPDSNSALDTFEDVDAAPFDPVFRDSSDVAGGKICVQPGVVLGSKVLFEPWVCLPTADAAAWTPPKEESQPSEDGAAEAGESPD